VIPETPKTPVEVVSDMLDKALGTE
jgi:hypothetical protein